MEALDWLLQYAERDPISFVLAIVMVVWWFSQRNAQRDDQNVNAALTLTTAIVATFQPLGEMLREIAANTKDGPKQREALSKAFETKAEEMKKVTERRDLEHEQILVRLDRHQTQLDTIAKQITAETDEGMMRGQMAKMLLLITEISRDTKQLIGLKPEPGEAKQETAEAVEEQTSHEQ